MAERKIKTLVSNFISFSILQGMNILIPLLTIPFLVRMLGVENFGKINFIYAILYVFSLFVEYGFNNSGTLEIVKSINDEKEKNKIFNEIISTKLALLLKTFIALNIVLVLIPKLREDYWLFIVYFGFIVGQSITPQWYFQGIQKMKILTIISVICKFFALLLLFVLVKGKEDLVLALFLTSLGFLLTGVFSLLYVLKYHNFIFKFSSYKDIVKRYCLNFYFFLPDLQVSILSSFNIIALGFFTSDVVVGYYAAADKLIKAISNMADPILNSFYPYLSNLYQENYNFAIKTIKKLAFFGSIVLSIPLLLFYVFREELFMFIFDEKLEESILIFNLLLIVPLFSFLDRIFGRIVLLINNNERKYSMVFTTALFFNVVVGTVFILNFTYIGAALNLILTQFIILIGMFYYSRKYLKND